MQGEQIADTIEKLIDAKITKQAKVAAGSWTSMDESLNHKFISARKAELAKFFPKNVLFIKDPNAKE
jgi:hypothetical protein